MHDFIFTIGNAILFVALLPTVRAKEKPALKTSVMTASILFVFGLTFASLGLYLSGLMVSASGVVWSILAYQKYKKNI